MTRILVHAGFYKTGTTSLQDFMAGNRRALAPMLAYYGPGELRRAGQYAREYAQRPFPWRLWRFRRALRHTLSGLPDPGSGLLVLSRENFAGALPGHRDWRGRPVIGFPAAEKLLRVLANELHRRFGPEAEIELLFTTRTRESWIASLHGHLLRSIALTEDLDRFAARFPADLSPASEAARLARALAPIPVHVAALEEIGQRPEGPATAILDLAGVPAETRAALRPARPVNTGQPAGLRAEFLALNRQGLSRKALKAAKERLLQYR